MEMAVFHLLIEGGDRLEELLGSHVPMCYRSSCHSGFLGDTPLGGTEISVTPK